MGSDACKGGQKKKRRNKPTTNEKRQPEETKESPDASPATETLSVAQEEAPKPQRKLRARGATQVVEQKKKAIEVPPVPPGEPMELAEEEA